MFANREQALDVVLFVDGYKRYCYVNTPVHTPSSDAMPGAWAERRVCKQTQLNPGPYICLIYIGSMIPLSEMKLIRTDITLDFSQEAEKVRAKGRARLARLSA